MSDTNGIYLVGTLPSSKRPNPSFIARNVSGEARPISQLEVVASPLYIQSGFALYRANIGAFMASTFAQASLVTNVTGFEWTPDPKDRIFFPSPYVSFRYNRAKLTEAQVNSYQEDGGMVIVSSQGMNTDVIFKKPDMEILGKFIQEAGIQNARFNITNDRQTMTMYSFNTFYMALDLVSLFLRTRTFYLGR
jgi:hypothetical protein